MATVQTVIQVQQAIGGAMSTRLVVDIALLDGTVPASEGHILSLTER